MAQLASRRNGDRYGQKSATIASNFSSSSANITAYPLKAFSPEDIYPNNLTTLSDPQEDETLEHVLRICSVAAQLYNDMRFMIICLNYKVKNLRIGSQLDAVTLR